MRRCVCESTRVRHSVKEQNVDGLGVFDVDMIDWTLAVLPKVCESVCV